MRLPSWTPEQKPQPDALVNAVIARRGGALLNLDRALLWSEPVARAWNVFFKAVRVEVGADRKLCELGICTVALLTGADYEYGHHAPEFLKEGGTQAQLDALQAHLRAAPRELAPESQFSTLEGAVVRMASHMTLDVKVPDDVFNAVRAFLDPGSMVELVTTIAAYNMVARVLLTLEIKPEHP
jgi:alkylhydroperoxidase family enzyme